MTETGAIARRVLVDGHVQGVGYREFTRRAAMGLGVSGWVRNRYDGAVEALIRGPPPAVEALVAEMRQGPRFADVNGVSVSELDETPGDDGGAFVIRATAESAGGATPPVSRVAAAWRARDALRGPARR